MKENCNFIIKENAIVDKSAKIGKNCFIDYGAVIYPNVVLEDNVYIGPYSIIGAPTGSYFSEYDEHNFKETVIGRNSVIRSHNVIYENTKIGYEFQTGHHVTIRENSVLGHNCSVGTFSDIQGNVNIGDLRLLICVY